MYSFSVDEQTAGPDTAPAKTQLILKIGSTLWRNTCFLISKTIKKN